jgi:predicted transcriptional regulator
MGYRGKVEQQEQARSLRSQAWTLSDIATELGVAKSSVSLWVRDVDFNPQPRKTARRRGPNKLQRRKADDMEQGRVEGLVRLGVLNEQAFLAAGAALYAGEGAKRDGTVLFANSDPRMVSFFCAWLRSFFDIDETRLRARVYLHEGLDLEGAHSHWSRLTGIPIEQFHKPYRAEPDASIRINKHEYGCAYIRYACATTHRSIMGLIDALLTSSQQSGVAQSAEQGPVKPKVVGSSPTPGAQARQGYS